MRPESDATDRIPRPVRRALGDCGHLLTRTARLFLRHWPALVAIALIGGTGRSLLIRAAVHVSTVNTVLAWLVVLAAPLSLLTAFVVMLRVLRSPPEDVTSPGTGQPPDGTRPSGADGRRPALVRSLTGTASLLLPFLGVYELAGYLDQDRRSLAYAIQFDRVQAAFEALDPAADVSARLDASRLGPALGPLLAGVVVTAVTLRFLITRYWASDRRVVPAVASAYLETVWLSLVMVVLTKNLLPMSASWLLQRRIAVWAEDLYRSCSAWWGPLGTAVEWLAAGIVSADRVLLLPMTWLAVAGVVYRRTASADTQKGDDEHAGRFGPLVTAIRRIRASGLVPALAYCLAFAALWSVETLLSELTRVVVGPRPVQIWYIITEITGPLFQAVSLALLLSLVAAASILGIDRLEDGPGGTGAIRKIRSPRTEAPRTEAATSPG
ncbi:MAG: hypothetical protein QG622_1668 [Actinomycetota bacterium]|nr:hypothetical protein [Actinomycetota bacterium]